MYILEQYFHEYDFIRKNIMQGTSFYTTCTQIKGQSPTKNQTRERQTFV